MGRLMLALLALSLVGCPEKKAPPPVEKKAPPPAERKAAPVPAKEEERKPDCPAAAKVAPGATMVVGRSPAAEEGHRIQVVGKSAAKVDLYKEPGGEAAGKLSVKKGKEITFSEGRVVVSKPLQLAVPGPQKLQLSFVDRSSGELVGGDKAPTVKRTLGKGASVGYVVYGGEGSHYLVVDGCFALAIIEHDEKNPWILKEQQVAGRQWWVKAKGGWLLVDDKVFTSKGVASNK